jgi:ParB family chromosome partitioning protein
MTLNTRRSFGTGLDAILEIANKNIDELSDLKTQAELKQVMVQSLLPGKYQARKEFNPTSLKELSDSIAEHGVLQPILVRKTNSLNEYEIVAGERRWRAAQMAGLQQVPVIVCDVNDTSALAFGLIENIQRQDLNPIEEATALKRLLEEFQMTHEKIAQSIGRSRAMVSNTLRLLNLTPSVQKLLIEKKIEVGHARLLLVFTPEEQEELASIIIEKNLSVRSAEKLVSSKKTGTIEKNFPIKQLHPNCQKWSRVLGEKLSSKVNVIVNDHGTGKVVINVDSVDKLEWLIESLVDR